MDFLSPFLASPFTSLLALLLFVCGLLWISRDPQKKKKQPPQPSGSWPVIGHLHLLGGKKPPYVTLGNMADKYGPIFTIKMGLQRVLVVSGWEIAKECFTTNDRVFASRPKSIAMEILGYNYAMFGFSPYGPYWRHTRKISVIELLSNHRLETFSHVRESEIKAAMKELHNLWGEKRSVSEKLVVEMKRVFSNITVNMIFRIILGRRFVESYTVEESNDPCRDAMRDFFDFTGRFMLSDAVPFLRWLDLGGQERAMKKIAKELDHIAEEWLEEHKRKRALSGEKKREEDFMDVLLSVLNVEELPGHDPDIINKATSLGFILAASDTTTVTLTWALSLLLNNREALKKAQDELDMHVGRERQLKESDTKNLVYLQAIIKETLRLYPAGPLLVPHESTEDCNVGGYHIPKGTQLIINATKLQRDPRVWADPDKFQPERFLTTHKDFDIRGQNFELIPFGSGRRMCPGVSFALQVLQLTLANLLHGFDIATQSDEPVDMSEGIGLTNLKVTPLEVLIAPRLPAHLYG